MTKKLLIIMIFILLSFTNAYACSCSWNNQPEPTEKEIFDKYENVFIGKIIDISKNEININKGGLLKQRYFDKEVNYTLKILSKIKGNTSKNTFIFQEIEVGYKECDCSTYSNPLKKGQVGDIFSLYIGGDINNKYLFSDSYNKKYSSFKKAERELLNLKNKPKLYFKFLVYKNKFNSEYNGLFTRNSVKTTMLLLLLLTIFKMFKYYTKKILYYIYLVSVFIVILGMIYLLFSSSNLFVKYDYGLFQHYSMIFFIPLVSYLLFNLYKYKNIKLLVFYIAIILFCYTFGVLA